MKFTHFSRKSKQIDKLGHFSDFFLNASTKQKKRVVKEAARKANEDQREVFFKSQIKSNAN